MSKKTFLSASISGDYGQSLVIKYLEGLNYTVEEAPKRLFYDWDVRGVKDGKTVDIEVKYDSKAYMWAARRNAPDMPNLYIEFKSTSKDCDSGIIASKADFYFYILKTKEKDIAYVFDRLQLLAHLQMGNYKVVGNGATGDNNALGWIPPLHEILVSRYGYKATIDLTPYA